MDLRYVQTEADMPVLDLTTLKDLPKLWLVAFRVGNEAYQPLCMRGWSYLLNELRVCVSVTHG